MDIDGVRPESKRRAIVWVIQMQYCMDSNQKDRKKWKIKRKRGERKAWKNFITCIPTYSKRLRMKKEIGYQGKLCS